MVTAMPSRKRPERRARGARKTQRVSSRLTILPRLRKLCLSLPDAREKLSHGEPTWFSGAGKVFAMFDDHHHGAEHVSVWLPAPDGSQRVLIASDPERFWRPPYVGHRGWIALVLERRPDWKLVAELVEQAYRLVAPARLVARLAGIED